jgi:predicted ribosomally synthesized peptide with SipW-like signal peptide
MSKRVKQYLMLLAALGIVAVALGGGSGTFASFNAVVSNNDNVFATGTLFLHNTTNGTTCTSESTSNNANLGGGDTCSTIFNVSAADSTAGTTYYQVALKNAGTLDASDISFYSNSVCAPSAVGVDDGTVNGNQSSTSTVLVSGISLSIPSGTAVKFGSVDGVTSGVTASNATQIDTTTPVSVTGGEQVQFFPAFTGTGDGNLCSALGLEIWNMDTDSTPTQDPSGAGGTCVYGCATTHTLSEVTASENSLGTTLNKNVTKYIEVGIVTPDLDNSYQSQQAKLSLAWKIAQ